MKDFSKTNYHYLFFIIFFLIQLLVYKDYGFSNDEEISRLNGLVSFNYILEKFNIQILEPYPNLPKLENYMDKDYGVAFELFLVFIEKILNLHDTKSIYYSRHYFTSIFFLIGSIFFYLTLSKFFSKNISLLGTLIFIIHPRIFAQSFYNSKDIVFLVFFCLANFSFISFFIRQNINNIILLALSISLAICVRPMAIIIPILFLFFFIMENLEKTKYKKFILLIPFIFLVSFFTILFWPYLWTDPSNFFGVLKSMSKFRFVGEVFFNNEYFVAKYMPWYYLPITILTTTPIFQILLFLIGFIIIAKSLYKNLISLKNSKENIWKNELELFLFYSLLIIFITIFLIIEMNATVYGGWRQIYFIYPSIIFVCIYGLDYILKKDKIRKYSYVLIIFFIVINFYSLIKNHPYQYTFYNSFITNKNLKNFELDYYGVSNLDLLKRISLLSKNDTYKIYVFSVSPYKLSLNLLSKENKKKYLFVNDIKDAEFIISNHYYQGHYYKEDYLKNKHPKFIENYLNENFKLVYEIKSNNVRINSIYKKK